MTTAASSKNNGTAEALQIVSTHLLEMNKLYGKSMGEIRKEVTDAIDGIRTDMRAHDSKMDTRFEKHVANMHAKFETFTKNTDKRITTILGTPASNKKVKQRFWLQVAGVLVAALLLRIVPDAFEVFSAWIKN